MANTDFGAKITQAGADIYKSKASQREAKSIGGEILSTAAKGLSDYYKMAEQTKNTFLDSFDPDTYEVELLPAEHRGNYSEFAQELKNEVSEASEIAGKYSANPNSQEYKDAAKRVEDAKISLQRNYEGYKGYAELRQKLLSNPGGVMDFGEDNKAEYDLITSEEGYKYLKNTKEGLVFEAPGREPKLIKDLASPKFINPELSNTVSNNILNSAYDLGKSGESEDITKRNIRGQATSLASDRPSAHQIMFYGLSNDEDTRFADYYIIQKALEGEEGYAGIVALDQDGQAVRFEDIDVNGDGRLSQSEKAGVTINQEAFDAKFKELKNDKTLNYQKELTDFLEGMGMDQYQEGASTRQIEEEKGSVQVTHFGNSNYYSRNILRGYLDKINNGQEFREPGSSYVWRKNNDGVWNLTFSDGTPVSSKDTGNATRAGAVTFNSNEELIDAFGLNSAINQINYKFEPAVTTEETQSTTPETNDPETTDPEVVTPYDPNTGLNNNRIKNITDSVNSGNTIYADDLTPEERETLVGSNSDFSMIRNSEGKIVLVNNEDYKVYNKFEGSGVSSWFSGKPNEEEQKIVNRVKKIIEGSNELDENLTPPKEPKPRAEVGDYSGQLSEEASEIINSYQDPKKLEADIENGTITNREVIAFVDMLKTENA